MAQEPKATQTRVSATARRALVWDMRIKALSLRAIALSLKETHGIDVAPMTVQNDVQFVMNSMAAETRQLATEHRTVMLERIEQAMKAIIDRVVKGELDSIHVMVRLMERESKLVGADAPAKIDIEHRVRAMARERGFDEDESVRAAEITYQEQRKLLTAG